uniref:Protein kinase domain-containing protein n=1 Tax=Macrostomum lignano TaxID=282301 RepID=A0A1I8FGA2_9PLAT
VYATLHGPTGQSDHVTRELRQPPSDSAAAVPPAAYSAPAVGRCSSWRRRAVYVEPRRVRLCTTRPAATRLRGFFAGSTSAALTTAARLATQRRRWIVKLFCIPLQCLAVCRLGESAHRSGASHRQWKRRRRVVLSIDAGRLASTGLAGAASVAAPVYRPDWLGGCRTLSCLLACSAWLAAVWAVAVALVTAWSSAEVEKAWQMRGQLGPRRQADRQQQRRRRRWQRQWRPAQPSMTPSAWTASRWSSRAFAAQQRQRQRRQQQLIMARFDESQRRASRSGSFIAQPVSFAVRILHLRRSALPVRWVRRVGRCCLLASSRTAALAVEFALTAGCLVSPLFCLIFAASRTLAGASVSGLKRSNAARLCRQAVRHYRQLVAVESRRPISESCFASPARTPANDSLNRPATQSWPTSASKSWLPNRGIRWAVRLAGGCLLAATLTALICGHSVAQSALAIDCATRGRTIDEEPMRPEKLQRRSTV